MATNNGFSTPCYSRLGSAYFINPAFYAEVFLQEYSQFATATFFNYNIPAVLPLGYPIYPSKISHYKIYHYDGYIVIFNNKLEIHFFLNVCNCKQPPKTRNHKEKVEDIMSHYNQLTVNNNQRNDSAKPTESKFQNWNQYKSAVDMNSKRSMFEIQTPFNQTTTNMNTKDTVMQNNFASRPTGGNNFQDNRLKSEKSLSNAPLNNQISTVLGGVYQQNNVHDPTNRSNNTTQKQENPRNYHKKESQTSVNRKINQNTAIANQEKEKSSTHSAKTRHSLIQPQTRYQETSFCEKPSTHHSSAAENTAKYQSVDKITTIIEPQRNDTTKLNTGKLSTYEEDQKIINRVQKQCEENNLTGPKALRSNFPIKKDEVAIREAKNIKSAAYHVSKVLDKGILKTKDGQKLTGYQEPSLSNIDSTIHKYQNNNMSNSREQNNSGRLYHDNNENKPERSMVKERIRTFSNNDLIIDKENDHIDSKAKNNNNNIIKETNGVNIKNTSEDIENITEGIKKITLNGKSKTEEVEKINPNSTLKTVNHGDRRNIKHEYLSNERGNHQKEAKNIDHIKAIRGKPKYEQILSKSEENIEKMINIDYEPTKEMSNQVENSLEKISSVANEIQTLLDEETDITEVKNKISVIITESICAKAAVQTLKDNPVQKIQNETAVDKMLEEPDTKMSEKNGRAVDKDDLKEIRAETEKYETISQEFDSGIHYAKPVILDPNYEAEMKQENKFEDEKPQNLKKIDQNYEDFIDVCKKDMKTEQITGYKEEQNENLRKLKPKKHEDSTNKENLNYNDAFKESRNISGLNKVSTKRRVVKQTKYPESDGFSNNFNSNETTAGKFSNISDNEVLQRIKQNEEPTSTNTEVHREMEFTESKGNIENLDENTQPESLHTKTVESAPNVTDLTSTHQTIEKSTLEHNRKENLSNSMVDNNQYEENQMQDENFEKKMMEDKQKRITEALSQIENLRGEAENLIKKVDEFEGDDSDKNFIYLDEMITRVLLKLDNVETENDKDLRMKRKECIKFTKQGLNKLREKGQL